MYKLFFAPGAASMAPHAALEEIGASRELIRVDLAKGEHRQAAYLELNPHARVPTLVDGDFVMYEAAAIVMHLADRHPESGLAPAPGTPERGRWYQWLLYLSNTPQDAFMQYFHPDYYAFTPEARAQVKTMAERRIGAMWERLDAALASGPYLLGEGFSGCDLYLNMLARWSRNMARPALAYPNLKRCIDLVRARPAVERMMQAEGIA